MMKITRDKYKLQCHLCIQTPKCFGSLYRHKCMRKIFPKQQGSPKSNTRVHITRAHYALRRLFGHTSPAQEVARPDVYMGICASVCMYLCPNIVSMLLC